MRDERFRHYNCIVCIDYYELKQFKANEILMNTDFSILSLYLARRIIKENERFR